MCSRKVTTPVFFSFLKSKRGLSQSSQPPPTAPNAIVQGVVRRGLGGGPWLRAAPAWQQAPCLPLSHSSWVGLGPPSAPSSCQAELAGGL